MRVNGSFDRGARRRPVAVPLVRRAADRAARACGRAWPRAASPFPTRWASRTSSRWAARSRTGRTPRAAARGGVRHGGHRRGGRGGLGRDRRGARLAGRQRDRGQRAAPTTSRADTAATGRCCPRAPRVEQLGPLATSRRAASEHGRRSGRSRRPARSGRHPLDAMLRAAMSRVGLPYVWGAAGPDLLRLLRAWCSGRSPRPASSCRGWPPTRRGRAPPFPSASCSRATCSSTTPTRPRPATSRTSAIYLGNGWMIQAPRAGQDVETVHAYFGSEFAGAIRRQPRPGRNAVAGASRSELRR